jgi:heme/copper-type cytochrome/quinol oxidase subunit 3
VTSLTRRQLRIDGRRSTGVWGACTGAAVLAVIVAYFCYAHLYLAVSNDPWPPDATPSLPLLAPGLLVAWSAVVAAAAVLVGRPLRQSDDQLPRAGGLLTVTVMGAAAIAAGWLLVDDLGLTGTAHAHDASVLTLHALIGVAALAGVAISGLAAYEAARVGDHPWVAAAAAVSAVWWITVALAWSAVAAVIYLWPVLT